MSSFLSGPIGGLIMGGTSDLATQGLNQLGAVVPNAINFAQYQQGLNELWRGSQQYTDATRAVSGHYSDMYGGMGDEFARQFQPFASGLVGDYERMSADLQGRYGNERRQALRDYQGMMGTVNAGYDDRYRRNMDYLEGQGRAEREDLDQRYGNLQAKTAQNYTELGLGGTTVLPSLRSGIERDKAREVNRLNEGLNRQRLSADMSLSGDALSARERMGGDYANMYYGTAADEMNFGRGLQSGGLAMRQGLGQWGIEGDLANRYRAMQGQYAMDMAPVAADWEASNRRSSYYDMYHATPPAPINNNATAAAINGMTTPVPEAPEPDWLGATAQVAAAPLGGLGYGWGANMGRARIPDGYNPMSAMGYM